ncbi:MAG: CBS domain-containing protein [Abditibacteriaceae bacterium]
MPKNIPSVIPPHDNSKLDRTEMDLIERFIGAFNAIDVHLEKALHISHNQSFRSLVDLYAKQNKWWRDADWLRIYADVRNILVHDKIAAFEYPCVPTHATVERVERIRDTLLHPELLLPRFEKPVVIITLEESIADVLRIMHKQHYSHFPVYGEHQGKRSCVGLLTENGIARWLAEWVCDEKSLIDLDKERVAEVLNREELRQKFHFAPPHAPVREILHQFHDNPYLEAVLITPNGDPHQLPQGIITRKDVMEYRE